MRPPDMIEVRHLAISIRSAQALVDVSLQVHPGEIHAVLGQNGAGKTTLMKILGGMYPAKAYTGEITVAGQPVVLSAPHHAARAGIAVIPSRPSIFPSLTVAENIGMGQLKADRKFTASRRALRRRAEGTLQELGIVLDLDALAGGLDVGQKQMVAIARAAGGRPKLLVLDEPTRYAIAPHEAGRLLRMLRLLADRSVSSLYLTAEVEEAMMVGDRITVLRDGAVVATSARMDFDAATLAASMASKDPGRSAGPEEEHGFDGLGGLFRTLRFFGLRFGGDDGQ